MRHLIYWVFFFGLCQCQSEEERFEVVNKLRAVGVSISQRPIVESSLLGSDPTPLELTFHLLLPKGQSIETPVNYKDTGSAYAQVVDITIDEQSVTSRDLGALQLVEFQASVNVPIVTDQQISLARGAKRYRFGATVKSGLEIENIVGDFVVVSANDPSLDWESPAMQWVKPEEEETSSRSIELAIELTKPQEEIIRVQWFVSSGEVENAAAKESTWSKMENGEQTVVVAIYPSKSRFFQFQEKTITIQ